MQTTKRDISAVEASFELSNLPLYRCSHNFQNVSLSGARVLERTGLTLTKQTSLDKYLGRPIDSNVSWYNFICKSGYVPVISGGNVRCSWPLTEDFSRTMLLLHWPNWRTIQDIKPDSLSWSEKMSSFLLMPECPNFVKADVQRAMIPTELQVNLDDSDNDSDQDPDDMQPEWLELVRPNTEFKEDGTDFNYNDGGLEYDWSQCSHDYPSDYGKTFLDNVNSKENTTDSQGLDLPDVNIDTLNTEQRLAFDIVMNTFISIYKLI